MFDPDVTPPSPPDFTVDGIEAAESGMLLNWTDADFGSSNVNRYRVNRRINNGDYAVILTTNDQSTTNYLDTGTAVGNVCTYTIQAHNAGGWSRPSDEQKETSQGPL